MFLKISKTFAIFLFTLACVLPTNSERLHEQIYSSIEGGAACFRILNGTHQTGCSSSEKGAVGVVSLIKERKDAEWMVYNASDGPYMAVVSTGVFDDVVELFMSHTNNVAGILLYENVTMRPISFSQESKCPNEFSSSPESQCSSSKEGGIVWNEGGTGLLRRDIPFPMFYLPESRFEEIEKIEKCYQRYNIDQTNKGDGPLCALQLNSFMLAAVNTVVCTRRSASSALLTPTKVCDPLGDSNVYYSLFPRGTKKSKESVTFVTARIDTASLFDGVYPGAASSVVGLVTLISAATALSQMIHVNDSHLHENNVLWTLFNGESFDYIGSQRVAYDMRRGAWPSEAPLAPADVRLHFELGQLGGALAQHADDALWPLHAFTPYLSSTPQPVENFLNDLSTEMTAYQMTVTRENTTNLPPSSLHSFRRILNNVTESGPFPELLLVDHGEKFTNKFYLSALDEYEKIAFVYRNISISSNGTFVPTEQLIANGTMSEKDTQVKMSRLATALARVLYKQVTGSAYAGSVAVSAHLVDEMLYCLLRSQACRLLAAAEFADADDSTPVGVAPLYVGVATWTSTAPVFAGHLLALLTGLHIATDRAACDSANTEGFSYYWLRGWNHTGVCIQTTMNFSQALSPAFIIPDYEMSSGEFSSWSESVWQAMSARVFVRAGGGGARVAGASGAVVTSLVAALTYWLRRHANTLFNSERTQVNNDVATGILRTVNC